MSQKWTDVKKKKKQKDKHCVNAAYIVKAYRSETVSVEME